MEEIFGISYEDIQHNVLLWLKHFIFAILILWLGMRIVRLVTRGMKKALVARQVDPSLLSFLDSLVKIFLQAVVIIATINQIGVATTSIVAILASAGLAIGMALSGTLQNFAGGAMILMFKPFKVGDFIEAQGYSGTVQSIQIFVTILTTPDNKQVVIPNGGLSNGSLINYSAQPKRRQEWTFGIDYGSDLDEAKQIIRDLLAKDERVYVEPLPLVELLALADSSVNIIVRAWVDSENFWPVYYDINTAVYKIFTERGISIPFPQLNVHLQK